MTKLDLDFSLKTQEERTQFINSYISTHPDLTSKNLETMANYILWGKSKDSPSLQISTSHHTWDNPTEESLDSLLEQPTFNESSITSISYKKPKFKLDRKEELQKSKNSPFINSSLQQLFKSIDETELKINYYEFQHNKRTKPPREELLNHFTPSELEYFKNLATSLTEFQYLKLRHLLVELRREQYTLKDSYSPIIQCMTPATHINDSPGFYLDIKPLGTKTQNPTLNKIFSDLSTLQPSNFSEEELKTISQFYWKNHQQTSNANIFDFRNTEHLFHLFNDFESLYQQLDIEYTDDNQLLRDLMDTLQFYTQFANLKPMYQDILDFKVKKWTNSQIQSYINKKYGKNYTENYISTLFRQKILPAIAQAVGYHCQIIENLAFPEEFKKCSKCKRILLKCDRNFAKKTRASDGLSSRCKECEKIERDRKKQKN